MPAGPPPGSRRPPAWQIANWGFRPIPFMERNRRAYGDVFPVDFGPQGIFLFIADPEIGREVFTAPADVLHPGEGARPVFEPILGRRSILVLDGSDHLTQRKLMLPAFHGDRMRALTGLMEEVAAATVASWPRGRAFALHDQMQSATLEIILRAVFGLAPGPQLDRLRGVLSQLLAREVGALSVVRAMVRHRAGGRDELREAADAEVFPLIDARLEAGDESGDDVLGMLLAARDADGERMTRQELRDELMTLLVAGHETTASSLAWCFEQLLRNPAVLERARAAAADGEVAWLDALVKETLRRRPVLPIAQPRVAKQSVTIGGREYEPGIAFAVCIYLIHHRPDLYPDPYAFRPERFLDGGAPGGYAWIPFGGGVRRCLGASFAQLEMRIVLQAMLRGLSIRAAEPGLERTRRRSITVSPRRGVPVVVADPASAPVAA